MVPVTKAEFLTNRWTLAAGLEHQPLVDLTLLKDALGPQGILCAVPPYGVDDEGERR
jgi:hypothetical protein